MVMVVKEDYGAYCGRGGRDGERKKGGGQGKEGMKKKREGRKRKEDASGGEPRILTTDLTTGFMRCLKFISPSHLLMLYED